MSEELIKRLRAEIVYQYLPRLMGGTGALVTPPDEVRLINPDGPEAADRIEALTAENERAWRERNTAYAKVKAWESVAYVEHLPLRAVAVDSWGSGEGGQTTVPDITPKKLTDLLAELSNLRAALEAKP